MDFAGQLIKLVHRLNNEHAVLLETMRVQQAALIQNDVTILDQCVLRLAKQLKNIEVVEKERIQVTTKIAADLGISISELHVTALERYMKPESYRQLVELSESLQSLLEDIHTVNEENHRLLAQVVDYTNHVVQTISAVLGKGTYGSPRTRRGGGLLDLQA